MIKAIIYDMDDLMINSISLHERVTDKLLQTYGHRLSDLPEDVLSSFIGIRVIDICRKIINYLKLNVDLESFYHERSALFIRSVRDEIDPMPGLQKSLKLFKSNNFLIALTSSGTKEYIDIILDKFNIRDYFDAIISGDDVAKGKPDPEPYLVTCQKLNLNPTECLVLEDAANGIASAKAAGCHCFAIKNPHTPPQDLSQADLIFNSLSEITINKINH